MLFKEIIAVYSDKHTKQRNKALRQLGYIITTRLKRVDGRSLLRSPGLNVRVAKSESDMT